jgi:hypothetical protein
VMELSDEYFIDDNEMEEDKERFVLCYRILVLVNRLHTFHIICSHWERGPIELLVIDNAEVMPA